MISYPFSELPIGQSQRLQEGLTLLKLPLPYRLNHVNSWIMDDGSSTMIFDTGVFSERSIRCWADALPVMQGTSLIVSHYHPDHVGMAGWMLERGAQKLVMTKKEWQSTQKLMALDVAEINQLHVEFLCGHGLDEVRRKSLLNMDRAYATDVFRKLPEADLFAEDGATLNIGGENWTVMEGTGHAPAQLCLYSKDRKTLIVADHILPRISPNISLYGYIDWSPDPLKDYLNSLDAFAALPEDTLILPSHGEPFYGLQERVEQITTHHAERLGRIEELCNETPVSAIEVAGSLFPGNLDNHQLIFAFGEAIAHLEHLRLSGRLSVDKQDNVCRYII